jgi:Flp pilus assembly protein TadD
VRYVADFTPEIALQQLTSVVLTDVEARSLYFNNLGVEALIAGDYPGAVSYLKNSLFLNNENSIAWNNIGAAYNRLGEGDLAEYSYRTSFELDANSSTAVGNLAKFYRARGELKRAAEFELAIERFNKKNPYYHFAQGYLAYDQGDLLAAQKSFEQAIELKEEEPDFYLALRQVYFDQGDLSKASELRRKALALVDSFAEIYRPSDERLRLLDTNIPQRGESDVRRRLIMPE